MFFFPFRIVLFFVDNQRSCEVKNADDLDMTIKASTPLCWCKSSLQTKSCVTKRITKRLYFFLWHVHHITIWIIVMCHASLNNRQFVMSQAELIPLNTFLVLATRPSTRSLLNIWNYFVTSLVLHLSKCVWKWKDFSRKLKSFFLNCHKDAVFWRSMEYFSIINQSNET